MNYVGLGGLAAEFVVGLVIFLFFAANKIIGNNPYLKKGKKWGRDRKKEGKEGVSVE